MSSIFVHIPAYRDSELPKTLRSLIDNARYPEKLSAGICHQFKFNDEYLKELVDFDQYDNIKWINLSYKETKGLCWARSLINRMCYNGERYYLQLDSHHRFAKDWDVNLVQMLENICDPMAIITGYPYAYFKNDPADKEYIPDDSTLINVPHEFSDADNHVNIRPEYIKIEKPIRARVVAGGFLFTYGHYVNTVKHDPNIFFSEEMPLSVRAYTHGYNLYHPHKQYVFHEYARTDNPKPWDDIKNWYYLRPDSRKRTEKLLFDIHPEIDLGEYGLGSKRTLEDYERYSGISFKNKKIGQQVLDRKEPS